MKKKSPFLVALAILLLLAILVSYISFSASLDRHMQNTVLTRLQESLEPNMISFQLQMNEQMKKVRTLAEFMGNNGTLGDEMQISLLQSVVYGNKLLRCAIIYPDGSFITSDGLNQGNASDQDFFKVCMGGETFISDPRPASTGSSQLTMLFASPITKGDQVVGILIYSYLCSEMNDIFNLRFLNDQGEMLVVKQGGQLLIGHSDLLKESGAPGNDILDYLRRHCTHKQHSADECMVLTGDHGYSTITLKGQRTPLLVCYDELPYNDWYTLSLVPEDASSQMIATITRSQRNMALSMAACVSIFFVAAFGLWLFQRHNVDKLTGALTLESFRHQSVRRLRRPTDGTYVFVKLDVKNFKLINRIYDFSTGDRVIKNIATALSSVLEPHSGLFARVGIDDFLLLLPYHDREKLNAQRDAFQHKFQELMGDGFTTRVEFPTGQYVLIPADFPRPDIGEILEKVNFAHRVAKQSTSTKIVDYVDDLEQDALLKKAIEDRMGPALARGEFQMFLQPKYRVADECLYGAEALVRWYDKFGLVLPPSEFIPILESNGFIVKLDYHIFTKAVEKIRQMLDAGQPPVTISVNFSRCHLDNRDFVKDLCQIADRYGVPHHYLEVELTESAVFDNVERIIALIHELHAYQFTLSMDDFGSGYSSLALLKDLEVDVLKIDKSFFHLSSDLNRSRIVISHVLHMAQELGIETVAEGIEVQEQVSLLRQLGCDVIQGFFYSKPVPSDQFPPPMP